MIIPFYSFLLPLCMLKFTSFFGTYFILDCNFFFLVTIFPLIFFVIYSVTFNFCNFKDKIYYNFIFFTLRLFLFFCFSRENPFLFLFFLESCVIFMLVLVFNFSKDDDKVSSTIFIFFINILGSIPFMIFCSESADFSYFEFYYMNGITSIFRLFCFLFILCSKLPIMFLHFWLTKVHVRASGSGSIILASLILKIGSYGLFKFSFIFHRATFDGLKLFFVDFSIFTCFFLVLLMNRFFDVKYLVACSSIVHMLFIFPFCLGLTNIGMVSSLLIIVGHGFVSCFIFFLVRLIYELSINRSMDVNKSIERFSKSLSLFIFFFFLINLGFPPFIRFIRELIFLSCFYKFGLLSIFFFCLNLVIVGNSFMTVALGSLFGKKNIFHSGEIDSRISIFSLIYIFFFFLIPLFYHYLFSLIKILLCGGKDCKDNHS